MLKKRIISLLHYCINTQPTDTTLFSSLSENDWFKLMQQAGQQSVLGLCLDALDKLRRTGNFPWIAPAPLTKYLSTTFRI